MNRWKNRRRLMGVALLGLAAICASCVSKTTGAPARESASESDNQKLLSLYKVEIDKEALKAGAQLLFAEPPPGAEFGVTRRCQGYIQFAESGYCSAEVKVAEPVLGLSGEQTDHVYTVLRFYGKIDPTGVRATIESGEQPKNVDPGRISEIRFVKGAGEDKLEVQAYSGPRATPYIFHFHKHALIERNIPFPWRPD